MAAMDRTLHDAFSPATERDVHRGKNIQARIRGNLLMALSNKRGRAAADHWQQVGAGGRLLHAVRRYVGWPRRHLADVPKTMVYRVARLAEWTVGTGDHS